METEERTITFFRFEDLRIYHKAVDYSVWVSEATESISNNSNDGLINKFNSVSRNIALNIAEGSARNKSQFIYYLKMAKSSIRECLLYTTITFDLNFFDEERQDYSRNQLMEMTKMIGALISSLQRASKRDNSDEAEMVAKEVTEDNNY